MSSEYLLNLDHKEPGQETGGRTEGGPGPDWETVLLELPTGPWVASLSPFNLLRLQVPVTSSSVLCRPARVMAPGVFNFGSRGFP